MSDIKVELNGGEVNRAIADAIVKSVLGESVVRMTNDYVKGLSSSWDSPIKKVVDEEVRRIIVRLVVEHLPVIEEEVCKQLAAPLMAAIVTKAVERFEKSIY